MYCIETRKERWSKFKLCSKPIARLRLFSSGYACVTYAYARCVHTLIYKHRVLVFFWEGEVGHPQSWWIRNCFLCFGTPAQAPVIAFSLWRLLLYQNLASVTEQSNSQGSSYYMTYLVCYHSLESRGTTSRNGPPQSLVPLKFIATELN